MTIKAGREKRMPVQWADRKCLAASGVSHMSRKECAERQSHASTVHTIETNDLKVTITILQQEVEEKSTKDASYLKKLRSVSE